MAHQFTHEEISVCAYYLWEQDGRPQGRDPWHWQQAEKTLRALKMHVAGVSQIADLGISLHAPFVGLFDDPSFPFPRFYYEWELVISRDDRQSTPQINKFNGCNLTSTDIAALIPNWASLEWTPRTLDPYAYGKYWQLYTAKDVDFRVTLMTRLPNANGMYHNMVHEFKQFMEPTLKACQTH